MKVTLFSIIGVALTALPGLSHGRALIPDASPDQVFPLLPRDSTTPTAAASTSSSAAAAASTSGAPVCMRKRDLLVGDSFTVLRRSTRNPLVKRVEKNIPGTNPLVSALKNIPGFIGSATGIVTNRLAHGGINKHSIVTGLKGVATFTGKLVIDGQQMTSPMPWIVRWDYDPDKGAHVNAEFGKGGDNPTFAYTFATNVGNYGLEYMQSAVHNLIKTAGYDSLTSGVTGTPTFNPTVTEAEAVAAIAQLWNQLMNLGCGTPGQNVNNPGNPNGPP